MFCIHCGKENIASASFCAVCGKAIVPAKKGGKMRFGIHHILGTVIILLFVSGGVLFARQEKLIKENRALVVMAEKNAEATIDEANQTIGSVKDELAQFKIKSAEDNAALDKKASQKPLVVERIIEKPAPALPTVAAVVKNWNPVVAQVACEFRYTNGALYARQSGSGTLISSSGGVNIITNKHVVADKSGYGPTLCTIKFPGTATIYNVTIDDITLSTKGSDMASIKMGNMNGYPLDAATAKRNYCTNVPDIGDEIVILGYPNIGGGNVTATEGIISGYEGSYYVTSAKVEHGNSGGAAIDRNNNCYLGIPTFVQAGQIESLARILKWQAF